jgi:hypothetical protein
MFYEWGIKQNHWLWFHILGGVYLALGLIIWTSYSEPVIMLIVFSIAVLFEFIMYWLGGWKKLSVPRLKITPKYSEEYWKKKRYKVDALVDILGAIFGALPVVIAYSYGMAL